MSVLCISQKEIESLGIHVSEVMDVVEQGFTLKGQKKMEMPAKIGIHPRHDCFIHAMPCWVGGDVDVAGIKWVSGYPINQARGLPYITGIMALNEAETGFVNAIMDANWITAWRTGAASGVCAKHMADPDSETIAVVGLGVQGRTNTAALLEALPKVKTVKVYDSFPSQVQKYMEAVAPFLKGAQVVPCATVEDCVKSADVVVTCTPIVAKPKRFVRSEWLKEEMLAISVDYDSAFDADVMTGATAFVCDDLNQYLWTQEQGIYFQEGYPAREQITGDMGQVCAGLVKPSMKGRRGAVLMGIASHDVMTARLILGKAKAGNVGTTVEI
jgi:ornithine cyclodeaminase/alanine dehydrogenase